MLRRTTLLGWAIACACGSAPAPAPERQAAAAIEVELFAPGIDHARFVSARLATTEPLAITGCVMPDRAPCEETARIPLDDDAHEELEALLGDLGERPACGAEAPSADDRAYALRVDDARYEGSLPADPTQLAARMAGPCRADARLAWWLARWLVAATRTNGPSRLDVVVDASRGTPRFVAAGVDLTSRTLAIEGCASDARACATPARSVLDDAARARLGVLIEDVRSEPCHVPFPDGAPLAIEAGLVYDGPCGADADLAWWIANRIAPGDSTP